MKAAPSPEQTLDLPGLDSPVTILRDEWGIPHVRAAGTNDAFFAQGYVHASDRLWQMDAARRQMEGRWAEWVGASALPADTLARRLQVVAASKRDLAALRADSREMLEAYARGVNAVIDEMSEAGAELPIEYRLLDARPEPWEAWHSIAAMRQRGYLMGSLWFKLWRAAALRRIPPEDVAKLRYDDGGADRLAVPPGADAERWIASLRDLAPAIEAVARLGAADSTGGGSNNWAVSPERTATGRPLLAGDPHRALEMPAMYTQTHLACPEFDAIGLSVPGVPGFPHFAHNGSVAWCVTHAFADIHDLYVEEFAAGDAGHYRHGDGWVAAGRHTEQILVREAGGTGLERVEVEVLTTRHGPVIAGDPAAGHAISLRSMQFAETDLSFDCLLPMLRAGGVDELVEASRGWGLIDHNVLMADTAGRVGHLVRAIVPRRPRLAGWLPVPGWSGEYDWDGMIPFDDMPRAYDPSLGYLATANNRFIGDAPGGDYFQTDCHPPYRVKRVEERLSALPAARVEDMAAIHSDDVSLTAPVFQARLRSMSAPLPDDAAALRELIVAWDGRMSTDSVAATAYTDFRWSLARLLAERSGLAGVADDDIARGPLAVDPVTQLWWTLPQLVRADDASLLGGGDWDRAFADALAAAARGSEPRPWGEVHPAGLAHPLAPFFPESAGLLSPAGAALGGDNDTVWATGCTSGTGRAAAYGAVARYVFDVGAWENSRWIVASGASGSPEDPHYMDQHAAWARCEMIPMLYDWDAIAASARRRSSGC